MEERTRQMKLKMNKYKPGAGSDSRLEQDYHKVTHMSANCGWVRRYLQLQLPEMCCAIWCNSQAGRQAVRHEHARISTTCCAHELIMLMKTHQKNTRHDSTPKHG